MSGSVVSACKSADPYSLLLPLLCFAAAAVAHGEAQNAAAAAAAVQPAGAAAAAQAQAQALQPDAGPVVAEAGEVAEHGVGGGAGGFMLCTAAGGGSQAWTSLWFSACCGCRARQDW